MQQAQSHAKRSTTKLEQLGATASQQATRERAHDARKPRTLIVSGRSACAAITGIRPTSITAARTAATHRGQGTTTFWAQLRVVTRAHDFTHIDRFIGQRSKQAIRNCPPHRKRWLRREDGLQLLRQATGERNP